jgi:hypothetical protein
MQRGELSGAARSVFVALAAALCIVSAVGGCAYHGPHQDDPVQRRFNWYSYLNGDDIRTACEEDAAPRYRFVYNGAMCSRCALMTFARTRGAAEVG